MKRRSDFALPGVVLALALAILACSGGAAATPTSAPTRVPTAVATLPAATQAASPTSKPAPTDTPAAAATDTAAAPTETQAVAAATGEATQSGTLDVVGLTSYVDGFENFHVVGLLHNGGDKAAGTLELTVKVADSSGASVLKDASDAITDTDTFSPLLETLAPGETSPFDYNFNASGEDTSGWKYSVEVSSSEATDIVRPQTEIANPQTKIASDGTVYLTGELVNKSDKPLKLNEMAAAMLDGPDKPVAAASYSSIARILAPAGDAVGLDRTPFVFSIDGPVKDGTQAAFYVDAEQATASDANAAVDIHVGLANYFVDENNEAHVVAVITNTGQSLLTSYAVAGLYTKDGKVLDADSSDSHLYLAAGESVPISFDFFTAVGGDTAALANVDSDTVQIDPYWTFPGSPDTTKLEVTKVTTTVNGSQVDYTGEVTNTTKKDLGTATIVIGAYDKDGKLIAAGWTTASSDSGTLAPGAKVTFDTTLELPTTADPATTKFVAQVQASPP